LDKEKCVHNYNVNWQMEGLKKKNIIFLYSKDKTPIFSFSKIKNEDIAESSVTIKLYKRLKLVYNKNRWILIKLTVTN